MSISRNEAVDARQSTPNTFDSFILPVEFAIGRGRDVYILVLSAPKRAIMSSGETMLPRLFDISIAFNDHALSEQ